MSLNAIEQAIVDTFAAGLPDLSTCEAHGGRFDQKELVRISRRVPALFVAILGLGDYEDVSGTNSYEVNFGCFLVTKDRPKQPKSEAIKELADAVLKTLKRQRWGLDAAEGLPRRIQANNLYGAKIDDHGVAMWGVTWRQRMDLGIDIDFDQLHDFLSLHHTIDVDEGQDGEPLAEDEIQLQE